MKTAPLLFVGAILGTICWGQVTPPPPSGGGSGTITGVTAGTGLSGGGVTGTVTLACVQGSPSAFGCVEVDNSTIGATAGVISVLTLPLSSITAAAAPTGTFDFSGSTAVKQPASSGSAPTVGGDIRYDSTQLRTVGGGNQAVSGSFPRLIYWAHPTSDVICARGGDPLTFSYSATCNNTAGTDDTGSAIAFTTQPSIPSGFMVQDKMLRLRFELALSTPSVGGTIPGGSAGFQLGWGSTAIYQLGGTLTLTASTTRRSFLVDCMITANTAVGAAATMSTTCEALIPGAVTFQSANFVSPLAVATNATTAIKLSTLFNATGIASGTYTSGITAIGTVGQTCALSVFNNGNTGGTATVALTGTNTIAGGTALVITNTGASSTSAATSATVGNGTATCTGPATVSTVLGGPQGNAFQLRGVTIEELN